MYGYVTPKSEELLVKELSLYRAFGCGLCRAMRRETGLLSALFLRYDFIFLALCRTLLEGRPLSVRYRRCPRHPFRRRMTVEENEALLYAAAASALVTYLKKEDDLVDRGLMRRIRAALTAIPAATARRRAALRALEARLEELVYQLYTFELEGEPSVDIPAELTGAMLGEVFSASYEGEGSGLLYRIGYHLGRFIYLLDALDDYRDDRKKKNYNPFAAFYSEDVMTLCDDVEDSLRLELAALGEAVEELPFANEEALEGIIKNILYLGMPARMSEVLGRVRKGAQGDRPI